ncbi:MAG: hypothetical protein ACOY0T_17115 [Myxococcota bacterium]
MKLETSVRFFGMGLALLATSACSGGPHDTDGNGSATAGSERETTGTSAQTLTGCTLANAVPLQGPNVSNRLGANACVAVIPPFLPSWWQYSDGTLRVQIADFQDNDNESAFPLPVQWENTCGNEAGSASYSQPWQQHELGHPNSQCSIVIKLGGPSTEDVLIYWGA